MALVSWTLANSSAVTAGGGGVWSCSVSHCKCVQEKNQESATHQALAPIWWRCPCLRRCPQPGKRPRSRSSSPPQDRGLQGGSAIYWVCLHGVNFCPLCHWTPRDVHTLPARDACGLLPVLMFMKVPVPMVIFTSPASKQHSPNIAACWSAI